MTSLPPPYASEEQLAKYPYCGEVLTDFDAIIEKGDDDDALVVVVLVEDKDPTIVVIVFFLSVFFFQSALLLQRVTLTSLFSFFNSMRYKKEWWIFSGWMGCISFFYFGFFCVCF